MFLLEGNIGVGKSTFLQLIQQQLPLVNVIFEPVDQWHKHGNGQSLLAQFYSNPTRWAYTMETFAMMCRVRDYAKEQKIFADVRIMERSVFSGHYCFAKNDYLNGFMNDLEWELYQEWASFLMQNKCPAPAGFIYLQAEPTTVAARIAKRRRSGETISLDYLEQLHNRHQEFLIEKRDITPELADVPVLILDCNQDFEHDHAYQQELIAQVQGFIGNVGCASSVAADLDTLTLR